MSELVKREETVDKIMEQVQVYASAYALVGSRFDTGSEATNAGDARLELRSMIIAALSSHEGMVMVPREPTDEMMLAASEVWFKQGATWRDVARAVVAASPLASSTKEERDV